MNNHIHSTYILLGKVVVKKHELYKLFDEYDRILFDNRTNNLRDPNSVKLKVYRSVKRKDYLSFLNWAKLTPCSLCHGIQGTKNENVGIPLKVIKKVLEKCKDRKFSKGAKLFLKELNLYND